MVSFVLDCSFSFADHHDLPEAGYGDHGDDVDDVDAGDDGEDDEPEPESDIDLLVDDVESQDTHGVVFLDCAGGSIFVEGTLGYSGENRHHRICSFRVLLIDEVENICAIGHEDTAEEEIEEVHLSNNIDEVKNITDEVLDSIHVVHSSGLPQVFHKFVAVVPECIIGHVDGLGSQSIGYFVQFLVLKSFPQVVRDVEHDSLQEKDKGNPLVVSMEHSVSFLVSFVSFWPHSWVGKVLSLFSFRSRNAEGGHDPAVSIEDIARDGVIDAGDGGTDEIVGSDEEASDEEDGGGGAVVELEERGVDVGLSLTMSHLYKASHRHQQSHNRHPEAGGLSLSSKCETVIAQSPPPVPSQPVLMLYLAGFVSI